MKVLFAMQRANGDWYALDEKGSFRVPVFRSVNEAMIARTQDPGMECFRPVLLNAEAFKNLTTTDEGKASFWLVADPLMKLSRGRPLDRKQLEQFMMNGEGKLAKNEVSQ